MLKPALMRHFQEYADSHKHPINRLTHKIAIPLIVFHIVAMLDWVKLVRVTEGEHGFLTLAHVLLVLVVGWYLTLNVKLGVLMALFYAGCIPIGWYTPKAAVIGIAVGAWLIQLAGHSIWEKNRPAFLKNMLQALIGPFFFAAILTGDWPPKRVPADTRSAA